MSFMESEITDKQYWLQIDGDNGLESIPNDLFNLDEVRAILDSEDNEETYADELLALVRDYVQTNRVMSAELVLGYGVRLSAPGYLDCTDWGVYTNLREAKRAARELCEDLD